MTLDHRSNSRWGAACKRVRHFLVESSWCLWLRGGGGVVAMRRGVFSVGML